MKRFPLLMTALAALACGAVVPLSGALAQQEKGPEVQRISGQDAKFLQDMARADLAAVAAGKLAVDRAQAEGVRKYGQLLMDAHGKLLGENEKVAKLKGLDSPREPDPNHQAALTRLEGASKQDFDRAYLKQTIDDQREALQVTRRAASGAQDANVKALAAKAAPHIEKQLEIGRQLAETPDWKFPNR